MKRSLWKLSVLASVVALGFMAAAQAQRGFRETDSYKAGAEPVGDAPAWGVEAGSELPPVADPITVLGSEDSDPADWATDEPPITQISYESTEPAFEPAFEPDLTPPDMADVPETGAIDFRKFQGETHPAGELQAPPIALAQADPNDRFESDGFSPNVSESGEFDQPDPIDQPDAFDAGGTDGNVPPAFDAGAASPDPFFQDAAAGEETDPFDPAEFNADEIEAPVFEEEITASPEDPQPDEPDRFSFDAQGPLPEASSEGFLDSPAADAGAIEPLDTEGVVPASHETGGFGESFAPAPAPDARLFGTQTAMITIEKTAPASVNVGETTDYEIVVRNTGSAAAHGVVVRDQVPRGARLLATEPKAREQGGTLRWDVGALSAGEERRLSVQLIAQNEGEIGSVAQVAFSAAASSRTRVTRPQLAVELVAPEEVMLGDELTLLVRISNPGTGTAHGVMLLNVLPESLEHPDGSELEFEAGTVAAGETQEVPLMVKAIRVGRVRTEISATGEGGLRAADEAFVNVVAPQLTLSQNGPRRRYLGRPATYSLTVSNPGTATATAVSVVDFLPPSMEFIDASDGGRFNPTQGTVTWSLGELTPGQTATVDVTALPNSAGEARNFARAVAARDLQAESELMTLVEGVPAILLEVVDIDDPIELGADTTYEIRVINQGSKSATNVRIAALVPRQLTLVDATGPSDYRIEGDQIVFEPVPRLGPRADTAFRIHVNGQDVGDVRFRVHLSTDQMETPVIEEESTRVYSDR